MDNERDSVDEFKQKMWDGLPYGTRGPISDLTDVYTWLRVYVTDGDTVAAATLALAVVERVKWEMPS
jgi:hypothetical protein